MFRTSICPSSGAHVVCYCLLCSALGVVAVVLRSRCVILCTVCEFVSEGYKLTHSAQDYTPAPIGPQPQHLVLNTTCSSTQPELLKMDI